MRWRRCEEGCLAGELFDLTLLLPTTYLLLPFSTWVHMWYSRPVALASWKLKPIVGASHHNGQMSPWKCHIPIRFHCTRGMFEAVIQMQSILIRVSAMKYRTLLLISMTSWCKAKWNQNSYVGNLLHIHPWIVHAFPHFPLV